MCGPVVMAAVRAEMNRRRLLGTAGATVLAGAFGARSTAARQATPVSGTVGGGVSLAGFTSIVDLTHTLTPEFPVFPGYLQAEITTLVTVADDGFYANQVSYNEHTGTHMDAPAHFDADGLTADRLPVTRFVAPLAVVDIAPRAAADPDAQLLPDDILAWEAVNGQLPAGAFVAMLSGWEARLGDPAAFLNEGDDGALHFPGFHPDAARLLVEQRDIVGIGVDTLSIDYGASTDYGTHVTVLSAGKYGLENMAGLGTVPAVGATIIVGGPKHLNASGGPSRVFALV